jgi:hypothetical protein
MRRLSADLPDYWERCATRWRVLRAGPLADDAVDRRLAEQAAVLAPYIAHDHRRWHYGNPEEVEAALEGKRAVARHNLHQIDQFLDSRTQASR